MYGVVLEGGGLKGSYHLGAMKAVYECGYKIGGYVGTSIGSFNAAVLAQGDFERLYDAWYRGSSTLGLDVDEKEIEKLVDKKVSMKSIKYWFNFLKSNVENKGVDSDKLKKLYSTYIDEKKLRKSKIDYGMVTVSLTDMKPVYMYKEDIPDGEVASYVLASSYLPFFKQGDLLKDNKTYIDGGFFDNRPISLLIDKGYKDFIEIRTNAIGVTKWVNKKGLNIIVIEPSKKVLSGIAISDNKSVRRDMEMGYYDAMRVLKGYIGDKFYVIPTEDSKVFNSLINITDEQINNITKKVKISGVTEDMEPKKILFEKILPNLATKLKGADTKSYQRTIVSMIEYVLDDEKDVFKFYTFEELLEEFKKKIPKYMKKQRDSLIKDPTEVLILNLLKYVEM